MTKNFTHHIVFSFFLTFFFLLFSGLFFSHTLAGETTGTVTTGVSTGTSGTVIAPPILSPVAGTYSSPQTVSFDLQGSVYSCFTTDNSTPICDWNTLTCGNGTKYSSVISVASTTTVQAISCYAGGNTSSIGSDLYTISIASSSSGGSGGGGSPYIPPYPTAPVLEEEEGTDILVPENSGGGIDECTNYFADTKDHWAKKYICFLKEKEIVNGKNSGDQEAADIKFAPEDSITRAEVVKIAVLGFKIPELSHSEKLKYKNFPDISNDDWFQKYVAQAKIAGIINGRKDGTFDPNNSITRAEAVKILLLSAKISLESTENSGDNTKTFSDVPEYAWYFNLVLKAQEMKIISGKSDGKFHPDDHITRAEFSKITALLLEK